MIDEKLRDQSFVEKFDERKNITDRWRYMCRRHTEFWKQHDCPKRMPAQDWSAGDGKIGWFFPAKWIRDFAFTPQHEEPTPKPEKPSRSLAERAAYVDRAISRLHFREQACPKEIERWKLPEGTRITPSEVIYSDGTFESVDDLRLRHGKFYAGAPKQSAEQQNLEDMLRLLRRQREARLLLSDVDPQKSPASSLDMGDR